MGYRLSKHDFSELLHKLQEDNKVYGPTCKEKKGTFSANDLVVYDQVADLNDLELTTKTKFSPKEIIFPIRQTMFYFTEDQQQIPQVDEESIIIFLRPCDRNAVKRLDEIFLENGPEEDIYYQRLRDKVKFFVLECTTGFDSCFCVTMDSNRVEPEEYTAFLRFEEDELECEVTDPDLEHLIQELGSEIEFNPQFKEEDETEVNLPPKEEITNDLFEHQLWTDYTRRCIACGRCNTACPTCSCFTVKDIVYEENSNCGERQRMWAGCHIDGFTEMAGGHNFRDEYGDRMRYKTMHKIYDFNERFGFDMCVGCGRCDDICPEYISFSNCINKLNQIIEEGE
ncbi:anaerobic sulfite reductase subunit AsrA [Sporohalobacter salinus]|uniref:anaerobic sulfite reductase subunit AsrA n=1 Tax=Sporohalobacter salinus TaxID=1494606 RepID=UPI001960306F|nr:anaerobic sulfite reductase subunit AsrA [Sporohalobacter salinus]MBM7624722.1 anaerobic sulfite reductase subunit A [Sporohalobacter salinus]